MEKRGKKMTTIKICLCACNHFCTCANPCPGALLFQPLSVSREGSNDTQSLGCADRQGEKKLFGKERTNLSKRSHSLVKLVAIIKVDRD